MKKLFYSNKLILALITALGGVLFSCEKKLDIKPNQSLLIPATLTDFQALIDAGLGPGNVLGETSADNYYILDTRYNTLSQDKQAVYSWGKDLFPGTTSVTDWNSAYNRIMTTNAILEGIAKIKRADNPQLYDNVAGSAHFVRALAYYSLAQLFCKTYDSTTATSDLGVPIKLTSDINDVQPRASVQHLYDQILSDAIAAVQELPVLSQYKTRPTRGAAAGLLTRVYLITRQFAKAKEQADISLNDYSTLLDYNSLNASAADPVPLFNAEVLFEDEANFGGSSSVTYVNNFFVDTILYRSYDANDLRKTIFFKVETTGLITYKGSYTGASTSIWFTGLATDEIYLARAECKARLGDKDGALDDLNALLVKRYKQNTFIKITAVTAADALQVILWERKKELIFRSIRWTDLRRLNKEQRFATTITRLIGGQVYSLTPNSNQYVLPIPGNEMLYNPMPQNPR